MMCSDNKPSVVWEKWQDPFEAADSIPTHSTPEDFIEQPEYIDDLNQEEHEPQEESEDLQIENKKIRAILTPFGLIPYDETNNLNSMFNFWVGHTNFDITAPILKIIEKTPGVEILDIFSRYRFRIGIGKLFTAGSVMSDISVGIVEYLDKNG